MDTSTKAIQVLECVDHIGSGKNCQEIKKIQTVHQYKHGPSLQEVLLDEDIRDLPLLVFSIAGKTRGGKSFLLNLMIKYLECLEKKDTSDWLTGNVPDCFHWKSGIESITRGLWIYPKIYRLRDQYGSEVGVLLLDTEGMFDGEVSDGEMVAISGVSAAISYLQMFNIKEKITADYLESVVRNLIKGIELQSAENAKIKQELKNDYKLMFVVRDWIGEESFPFGVDGGKDYIAGECIRGTAEYKALWETIRNTFQEIDCVLLPEPGSKIRKKEFNESGSLKMLERDFIKEVKLFVEKLFDLDNYPPPSTRLTGEHIHRILTNVDGKIADENLSFLNIFTDHTNSLKVEKWISSFKELLTDVGFSNLSTAKSELSKILSKAEENLSGKSRETHLNELKKKLEGAYNSKVIRKFFMQYESSFQKYAPVEKQHSATWQPLKRTLSTYLSGDHTSRRLACDTFVKQSASHYYDLLHKEQKRQFEHKCFSIKKLEDCAGMDEKEIKSFKECKDFFIDNNEEIYGLWLKEYQRLKCEMTEVLLRKISDLTGVVVNDLKNLRRKQYEHFENFTLLNRDEFDMDCIDIKKNKSLLSKKVGYGMFGPPENAISGGNMLRLCQSPSRSDDILTTLSTIIFSRTSGTGYSMDKQSKISRVVGKIVQLSDGDVVQFACVYIAYKEDNAVVNVPIFKVKKTQRIIYVDSNGREYSGWNEFLASNTLPDIVYCYPLNGSYIKSEGFSVAFSKTPASETVTKILNKGDVVGKGVTGLAGVAGCALMIGATAPFWAPVAIVGGIAGGTYGTIRGIQKICDKINHGEPVPKKDYGNVALNVVSVVGAATMAAARLATVAAESVVIVTTCSGVTNLVNSFSNSDKTPELISLIAEVEESSLKILFYFDTTCSKDAISTIKKSLKLDDKKNSVETLLALLENNCIQYEDEKYVSQNVAELVKSLLKVVDSDVRDIVIMYCEVEQLFIETFVKKRVNQNQTLEALKCIMDTLCSKLEDEIPSTKAKVRSVLLENLELLGDHTFIHLIKETLEKNDLILAFRNMIWTLISDIRKANKFFNNIEHSAIPLLGHYLSDVLCHPLYEVSEQVKEIVEQTESAMDFKSSRLDYFLLEILKLLRDHNNNWTVYQFSQCLMNMTKDIASEFKNIVDVDSDLVKGKQSEAKQSSRTISCSDLNELTSEIGLEGRNYGSWVSRKVVGKLQVDVNKIDKEQGESDPLIIPAWSGILDNLFYYRSKNPVKASNLIKRVGITITKGTYNKIPEDDGQLTIYVPINEDITEFGQPSFVVYSQDHEGKNCKEGLIWVYMPAVNQQE